MQLLRWASQTDLAMISSTAAVRETRKYGRVVLEGTVRVSHANGSTQARACDLSCGGMSFMAPLELTEGDNVNLEFKLPYSNVPLKVRAAVRHRTGLRYGVEFQELTADEFGEIARVTAVLSFAQA